MAVDTRTPPRPRGRGLLAWLADGRALMDLWIATCGLGGLGLALFLVGAEVVRLGLLGRIDARAFASFAFDGDPIARGLGLDALPPPVAFGLCILCVGLVLLIGAARLLRARAEVMRLRGA